MNSSLTRRRFSFVTASATLTPLSALAQLGGEKVVRIVSGFPAGSSLDSVARMVAQPLEESLAARIIIEYKTGAGGRIANAFVKSAKPDGATMVMCSSSLMAIYPHVFRKLAYHPLNDFIPIAPVCNFEYCFVASALVPAQVRTVKDYLSWAKLDPMNGTYGSAAAGSMPHFIGALLSQSSGVALTHIPYNGDAPHMQALNGAQIPFGVVSLPAVVPHLSSGRVRVLATGGPQRTLDGVPTIGEAGFNEATALDYFGLFFPSSTPAPMVSQVRASLETIMKNPKLTDGLRKLTLTPSTAPAAEFPTRVQSEYERWRGVVQKTGFQVDE